MAKKVVQILVLPGGPDYDWLQLPADAFARFKRLSGWEVIFSVPAGEFSQLFKISPEDYKIEAAATLAQLILRLQQSGDVYKQVIKGPVCQDCGRPEPELHCCPICNGSVSIAERDGYFLRIHRHFQGITDLAADTSLILPQYQQGDVIRGFSSRNTEDVLIALGVSREKVYFWVTSWFQTLASIFAHCGYSGDEGAFLKLWSETYIFTPRVLSEAIFYWCGIILALQLPRPGAFVCHSPLQMLDRKGQAVSPLLLAKNYGSESLRYYMLAVKIAPGDNTYSEDQVIQKINRDLANELGNLVSRVISLVSKYAEGVIPTPEIMTRKTEDLELRETALETPKKLERHLESQEPYMAVKTIKNLIGQTNRFIQTTVPWQLAETADQKERLNTVLYNLCEALRFLAVVLKILLPEAAQSILYQLGIQDNAALTAWKSLQQWGLIPAETRIIEQPPLFPRIIPGYKGLGPEPDLIMRAELGRINMVVARVVSAETVADYEGLLQLILYDGRQRCRVLAAVAHAHAPAALSGKKVVMISNLRPTERYGLRSEGEVLVAEAAAGNLQLVFVAEDVPEGSKVLCLN